MSLFLPIIAMFMSAQAAEPVVSNAGTPCCQKRQTLNAANIIPAAKLWELVGEAVSAQTTDCAAVDQKKQVKNVIFLFEGHSGYNDQIAVNLKKLQYLHPVCKTVELPGQGTKTMVQLEGDRWVDPDQLEDEFHKMADANSATPVALKNFIIRGLCKQKAMPLEETEVRYFPADASVDEAVTCAQKLAQRPWRDEAGSAHYPSLSVLGFSRGGGNAILAAQALSAAHVKLDFGMTVDPLPRNVTELAPKLFAETVGYKLGMADGGVINRPDSFVAPAGVRWVNYWQESDNRYGYDKDGKPHGLHGFSVAGAAIDMLIVPDADKSPGNGAHWKSFFVPEVVDSIALELARVRESSSTKSSWQK